MMSLQSRSVDSSIFSTGGEDEWMNDKKLYRLPSLQHSFARNHYLFVALYRKRSLNKFTPILDIELWEEWMIMNTTTSNKEVVDKNQDKYPFTRLIENSVLPYLGQEEDKEELMRKYSKVLNNNNTCNNNHQIRNQAQHDSTNNDITTIVDQITSDDIINENNTVNHHNIPNNESWAMARNSAVVGHPENVRVEEFHFMHPNDEESTIHIDVVTLKRSTSAMDERLCEGESHQDVSGDVKITLDDIEIIGAVCDGVKLEKRRSFMTQLRELCEQLLMEYYSTSTNSSSSSSLSGSTTKKEKALSSYSDGEDQFMKKMFKPKALELINGDKMR